MTQKAGENLFFFLVFTSSLAGVFVKLKPPLKISRSAIVCQGQKWDLSFTACFICALHEINGENTMLLACKVNSSTP